MSPEEFSKLSPYDQGEFINSGGRINFQEQRPSNPASKQSTIEQHAITMPIEADPVQERSPHVETVEQSGNSSKIQDTPVVSGVSNNSNAHNEIPPEPTQGDGFDFQDPIELLMMLDDKIAAGINLSYEEADKLGYVKLHDWQEEFMRDFAAGLWHKENPFHALVRAANGSGKDKYVIAACAVWLCMKFLRAAAVVTSSSGTQLDVQTCRHIAHLCSQANKKLWPNVWKINYRHYTCLATGSVIDCFATDEPTKAEGYHPIDAGCKLALFMSEAKTVPDEIDEAYDRCNGYTHRVHVSSPGAPTGHFYDACMSSEMRSELQGLNAISPGAWIQYHVTAYDCPHIPKVGIERLKNKLRGGENAPLFKSSIKAEFTSLDEMVVLDWVYINKCKGDKVAHIPEPFNKAGLDLSDGGDETVLTVRNGNKVIAVIPMRFDNTEDTKLMLIELFNQYNLNHPEALIFADCGGMGKPILDSLRRQGWSNIRYVDNRHTAYEPTVYFKRGTEMWFHIALLIERGELSLIDDKLSLTQLATRYYKLRDGTIYQLLSKIEQKSRGYKSPDRADSLVLAFADYKSRFIEEQDATKAPFKQPVEEPDVAPFNEKRWATRKQQLSDILPSRGKDFSVYQNNIRRYNEMIKTNNNTN